MINKAINVGNTIGKGMSVMNLIMAIILSLIFGGIGIFFVLQKEKYTKIVDGKVISANCSRQMNNDNNKKPMYKCRNIEYNYIIDEIEYGGKESLYETNKYYRIGDNINLQYNPENKNDSRIKQMKSKYVGYIFVVIALIIFLVAFIQYYFVSNVRGAGSAYTAYTAYNYLKN